jgi:hypothetical protein
MHNNRVEGEDSKEAAIGATKLGAERIGPTELTIQLTALQTGELGYKSRDS